MIPFALPPLIQTSSPLKAFDYGKVGLVTLTPLNESERRETPEGNYYIYDGVHKSIVLAKRLLRGETEYEPVQVLLLTPS